MIGFVLDDRALKSCARSRAVSVAIERAKLNSRAREHGPGYRDTENLPNPRHVGAHNADLGVYEAIGSACGSSSSPAASTATQRPRLSCTCGARSRPVDSTMVRSCRRSGAARPLLIADFATDALRAQYGMPHSRDLRSHTDYRLQISEFRVKLPMRLFSLTNINLQSQSHLKSASERHLTA